MITVHDIDFKHTQALGAPLALLARAYHLMDWSAAPAAAVFIERVAADVLQYAEEDAEELYRLARNVTAAERLQDRARLARALEHLARFVARWPLDELSSAEADLFLDLRPSGTRQAIWDKRLPAIRRGRNWSLRLTDLIDYAQLRRKRRKG